jgi:hypothetical protein
MALKDGMEDHREEARKAVAIRYDPFPSGRRAPDMIRSSGVSEEQWVWMVHRAITAPDIHCRLIMADSEEGKAIINGTDLSNITNEFLLGLDPPDDDTKLRDMAKRFKLDVKPGTKKKVTVLRILTEIEKGAKPSEPVAAI